MEKVAFFSRLSITTDYLICWRSKLCVAKVDHLCVSSSRAHSHQAKEEAKMKKIKEQASWRDQRKNSNIKETFRFRLVWMGLQIYLLVA